MSTIAMQSTLSFGNVNLVNENIVVSDVQELLVRDRCERCGAQAFVKAVKDGSELLFCGHHGRKHFAKLNENGWSIFDYTPTINSQASVSANKE